VTEVEPAISVGGGVKLLMPMRVQLRVDFRAYMTPLPDHVFRLVGPSVIRGWLHDFVPLAGISYVFSQSNRITLCVSKVGMRSSNP
jgi:hypothetical protein